MNFTNQTLRYNDSTIPNENLGMSPVIRVIFLCMYAVIFLVASLGNTLALITCYKTYKITTSILLCYIASLASADLMFTILTVFNVTAFIQHGEWFGGNLVCKIQAFLIESSYSVSILTLVAISYERVKAVSSPILARSQPVKEHKLLPTIIWFVGFASCTPLLYAYHVRPDENSKAVCNNDTWGDKGRQSYYTIQAVVLFLFPLSFMTGAHIKIFRHLSSHVKSRSSIIKDSNELKQQKVTKMLAVVTLVFLICYGTFMVIRALRYFYIYNGNEVFKVGQAMIFGQAAANPITYCFYSKQFRLSFKDLLRCRFSTEEIRKKRSASSRSTTSLKADSPL